MGVLAGLMMVICGLMATSSAQAATPAQAARPTAATTVAAADCAWCLPPNAPPPRCVPWGQYAGDYYWEYYLSKTISKGGHGTTTRFYYISATWSLLSRKVSCSFSF